MARYFKKIKAWKKADDLVWEIFNSLRSIPENEGDLDLKNKIKDTAIQIPVMIARGSSRKNNVEFLNYLKESMSYINELDYLIHLSKRLGYLKEESFEKLMDCIEQSSKLIFGLKNYLEKENLKD